MATCSSVRNTHEIFVDLRAAGEGQRRAQTIRLLLVGLAAVLQRAGDLRPSPARQIGALENFALDILDPIVLADTEHGRHLRRCGLDAAGRHRSTP